MADSKVWLEYRRLFSEMERKREAVILTEDEEHHYMADLGILYPKLSFHEQDKAVGAAMFFYNRRWGN